MGKYFNVNIDISAIKELAGAVGELPKNLVSLSVDAVNFTAKTVTDDVHRKVKRELNMPLGYMEGKTRVSLATDNRPKATVTVSGSKTSLARYDAKPEIVPAVSPLPLLKGFAALGIPRGRKMQGVSVKVKNEGGRSYGFVPRGFLLPLRSGNQAAGNGFGMFVRDKEKVRHIYGPSPYQIFNRYLDGSEGDIYDLFTARFVGELDGALKDWL